MTRRAKLLVLASAVLVLAGLASLALRPRLERAVQARIEREARQRGLVATVALTRVGLWPPLELRGLRLEKPGAGSLHADSVTVTLRARGQGLVGHTHVALGHVTVQGPAGLSLESEASSWDLSQPGPGGYGATLREPSEGLEVEWQPVGRGGLVRVRASAAPLGELLSLRRDGRALLDAGLLSGQGELTRTPEAVQVELDFAASALRFAGPFGDEGAPPALGPPANVGLRLRGAFRPAEDTLELREWRVSLDGAALSGTLALTRLSSDPLLEAALEIERLDFARLFATSGLPWPAALAVGDAGEARAAADLGSASLSARVSGRLHDAASFVVKQQLDFRPPRATPPALARLRGDFVHVARPVAGAQRAIQVSPESPDFVALREVPPLFVRTLLLAEDSSFLGHHGIDLSELPSSLLRNLALGRPARGASTITQQLAKNLFLSREKRLGRKLQELSLALLLESTLSKQRILEIYLNVIEWGPDLYGLRPASRRYFRTEPGELRPAQMALLVSLIPGPVKYQSSLAHGAVSPGFRNLVDELLFKLRSVDALSEDEYQAALGDELVVDTQPGGASAGSEQEPAAQ